MIGLGSNRLSVCRRGGMSVTQAGRGGMEWLAGGRMPSWASPYSAQATAALLAQFPTQWPTIRDYGFAHPALVPFINEDPMMVMSLIEGLGTRWIASDGNCWVDTEIVPDTNTEVEYKFKDISGGAYDGANSVIGVRVPDTDNGRFYPMAIASNTSGRFVLGGSTVYFTVSVGNEYTAKFNEIGTHKSYLNGVLQGTHSTNALTTTGNMYIFAANVGNNNVNWKTKIPYAYVNVKKSSNSLLASFVPFISQTYGKGMLDVIGLAFHRKIGSGSFTISETPAS